jgi:TFIIF-interacting CTD phosphatase-like protein
MIKVGEQGIFLSDDAAKKVSPYILSQLKKTLVLNLNSVQSSTETDPAFTAWLATPPNLSEFNNDIGAGGLSQSQIQNLNMFRV